MKPNGQPVKAEIPTQAINWFIFYGKIALQLTSDTKGWNPCGKDVCNKAAYGEDARCGLGSGKEKKKKVSYLKETPP